MIAVFEEGEDKVSILSSQDILHVINRPLLIETWK